MAVRRGARHGLRGDEAVRAGLRLDDHVLAEDRPQRLGDDAADELARAAGREAVHDAHVARGFPGRLCHADTWKSQGQCAPGGKNLASNSVHRAFAVIMVM